ncbi:hypothetical protein DPMN_189968, partial [Dreissena polymorpha]
KRGYIILHMSVGPSVGPITRWFPDDNSRTLRPRIMKLHRYIDNDWQMTPFDFQVTSPGIATVHKKTGALPECHRHSPGLRRGITGDDRGETGALP